MENIRMLDCDENLEVHSYLKVIPEMPEDLFQELKEDIGGLGVINPIVLVDGKILDGRARYRACRELGIACPAGWVSDMSPTDCVRSMNIYRRHLSEDQQLEAGQRLINLQY